MQALVLDPALVKKGRAKPLPEPKKPIKPMGPVHRPVPVAPPPHLDDDDDHVSMSEDEEEEQEVPESAPVPPTPAPPAPQQSEQKDPAPIPAPAPNGAAHAEPAPSAPPAPQQSEETAQNQAPHDAPPPPPPRSKGPPRELAGLARGHSRPQTALEGIARRHRRPAMTTTTKKMFSDGVITRIVQRAGQPTMTRKSREYVRQLMCAITNIMVETAVILQSHCRRKTITDRDMAEGVHRVFGIRLYKER
jgi:histone H3/H4